MELENKRKQRIKIGSFLLMIFLLIYIPSLIHWIYGRDITTEILRYGTIEDSVNAEGMLVRDEEVLKSPFDGNCITTVNEGDKIAVRYRVATILNSASSKLLDDIKNLDLRIVKAQKEKSENQDFFSEDIGKIEGDIAQKLTLVVDDCNNNSLMRVRQYREEIDGLIRKKASIFGGSSNSDAHITSLKKEKESLQAQINSNTREIYSESSGVVSYMIDGNEDALKPSAIQDFTPKFLSSVKTGKMENVADKNIVQAGKPFAKIIKDIDCYVVFALEPSKAKMFKVDDSVKVRINEINRVIDATVEYKSNEEDGKYIVAVKIDKALSEMTGLRKVNADLIKNSYYGLKVRLQSLRDIDMKKMEAKLVIVSANNASIRAVQILGKNDEFAIIKNPDDKNKDSISLYNTYVVNPENIQEGQVISQ